MNWRICSSTGPGSRSSPVSGRPSVLPRIWTCCAWVNDFTVTEPAELVELVRELADRHHRATETRLRNP